MKNLLYLFFACLFITSGSIRGKANLEEWRPMDSLQQLSEYVHFNDVEFVMHDRVLVFYTTSFCKPCLVFAEKLNKEIKHGKIEATQIVYVNLVDFDSTALKQKLLDNDYVSPYFVARPQIFAEGQSFPYIVAYTNNRKDWDQEGYDFMNSVKRVREYLAGHDD